MKLTFWQTNLHFTFSHNLHRASSWKPENDLLVHDHEDMYVYGKERKCDVLREAQGECCLKRSVATVGVIMMVVLPVVTVLLASVLLLLMKASGCCLDARVSQAQRQCLVTLLEFEIKTCDR